jgi:hypothetical protein
MTDPPRFAVLFKAHGWDDFVVRQFQRLQERAAPGDVFVVLDETKGPIEGVPGRRVLRMTEAMAEEDGYLWEPRGNLFWQNTDYQLYRFADRHPQYDYIVICEYDCVVNVAISAIVAAMAEHGASFAGERIRTPPAIWHWAEMARPYYPPDADIFGRLLCFAAFSRDFVRQLQAARRDHTRRVLAGEIESAEPGAIPWPNNEAFVGAEILRQKVRELPLAMFGDVARYDWAPPYPESDLERLRDSAVLHPVLDETRHIRSLLKIGWDMADVFRQGSHVRSHFAQCDPAHAVAMLLRHFAETKNWEALARLHAYAAERLGDRSRDLFNVAQGKPATQSSISPWSNWPDVVRDAAGAVDGRITGGFGFHTHLDEPAWWCVDLQTAYPVTEIRVHNRLDMPHRAGSLVVSGSTDMAHWTELYRHEGEADFGGADGAPLVIRPPASVPLRFLRIHLAKPDLLHLDEVQVFI